MEERHHVKTTPGEAKAPEIVPGGEQMEPGATTQAEGINIPMVALVVAFFAVCLAVLIVSLQAWFYSSDAAERARKQQAEYDPDTPLGALVLSQQRELTAPVGWSDRPGPAKGKKYVREPIDRAMTATVAAYDRAQASAK